MVMGQTNGVISMSDCQNIVSKEPLEYCGNEDTEQYDLEVPYEGGTATGSAYFCDECKPPEEHQA